MKIKQHFLLAATVLAAAFPTTSTSANFEEASTYIDLDGSMLGYIDFEGDGQEIGTSLNEIYQQVIASTPQMPPIPVDFNLLIDNLGFGSIRAIALSSKEVESGLHRNRSVALLNDKLSGLFALYNTDTLTFTAAEIAPADATGAMTASVNLGALRDTSSLILQQIMGPMGEGMVQQQLAQVIPETDVTYNLRQIAAAADQYFLENGVTEVSIEELVGEGGYIRALKPVAGESYEGMVIKRGEDISVVLENGSVISMPF